MPEVKRITASSSGVALAYVARGACTLARDFSEKRVRFGPAPFAEPQPRRVGGAQKIVEAQAVLVQDKLRLEPRKDVVELVPVHLDVDGADGGAVREGAQVAQQVLDRVVGEERDPIIRANAALMHDRGKAVADLTQLAIADCAPVVGANEPLLFGIAARRGADPIAQTFRTRIQWHAIELLQRGGMNRASESNHNIPRNVTHRGTGCTRGRRV